MPRASPVAPGRRTTRTAPVIATMVAATVTGASRSPSQAMASTRMKTGSMAQRSTERLALTVRRPSSPRR